MAFWKQSEDPWERKPEKRRPPPKEPRENHMDSLKAWNEERKARAKEKEEAKRLPPEKCPWCGKDMEQGYMMGGRGITWYAGVLTTKAAWIGDSSKEHFNLESEGVFTMYKTVWLCRDCKKMIFDMPDPPETYDPFAPRPEAEETKEEEASEE